MTSAGISAARIRIERNGLMLPSYSNSPRLVYIVQGRANVGIVIPGCPETYQQTASTPTRQQESEEESEREREGRRGFEQYSVGDSHQRITSVRQGDVVAIPAGSPFWVHNDGDQTLVAFAVYDVSNNQLDQTFRHFRLAGGQTTSHQQQREQRYGESEQEEEEETSNGVDEASLCSMKLRENVGDPGKADMYTPNGGRITVLNSHKLPVVGRIQMSLNRGVMRPNAILAPHWNMNAHALVYATAGRARVQVVSDAEIRRGQALVVPESFAVMARAGNEEDEQGFAWVSFQTSDDAMNAPIVGKTSAMRGMPLDVLANAFGVSRDEARRIKFGRGHEMAIFSPSRDVLAAVA
ncbi:hypothetical protein PR202_gb20533 [Eleusine coracana subsp. coracana]|uniref:Cupin type-1 domain-containing protein n=1 Tax=Eleusine coracana subsp. coracana TaxID=191504 RepID=A0AAV5FAV5_ELECO|nr:hypothetical protein QOZ80_1BG0063020 [Eleusine coracana subsp. coracana]GJN32060.1 hypothetical protein PR202_gb20533 [Eleusine coracana subsp. coracana]